MGRRSGAAPEGAEGDRAACPPGWREGLQRRDNSWEIMNLLERINLQGTTVLMATHNSQIVNTLRHRVIAIENGRVVRDEAKGEYGYDD